MTVIYDKNYPFGTPHILLAKSAHKRLSLVSYVPHFSGRPLGHPQPWPLGSTWKDFEMAARTDLFFTAADARRRRSWPSCGSIYFKNKPVTSRWFTPAHTPLSEEEESLHYQVCYQATCEKTKHTTKKKRSRKHIQPEMSVTCRRSGE